MDESWRMKMGIPANSAGSTAIELEDFDDVFGGPPRSLLLRKFSADFSGNDWFYDEIFRPLDPDSSGIVSGQRLPEFMIPGKKGSRSSKNKKVNKMFRSKSTSSYVMSFDDELHQLNSFGNGNVIGEDDVALSSFTTKLRPINVPSRWTKSSTSIIPKNNNKTQDLASFGNECNDFMIQSFNFGHQQIPTSPQPINNNEHINNSNHEENVEYYGHLLQVEDDDVIISSYDNAQSSSLVEVNNNAKAIDIDEAIAWAKEKFQGWSLNDEGSCIKEHEASFFAS